MKSFEAGVAFIVSGGPGPSPFLQTTVSSYGVVSPTNLTPSEGAGVLVCHITVKREPGRDTLSGCGRHPGMRLRVAFNTWERTPPPDVFPWWEAGGQWQCESPWWRRVKVCGPQSCYKNMGSRAKWATDCSGSFREAVVTLNSAFTTEDAGKPVQELGGWNGEINYISFRFVSVPSRFPYGCPWFS